ERPTDREAHIDAIAEYYAGSYRGTFLLVFLAGALALSLVLATARWAAAKIVFIAAELLLLLGILRWVRRERRGSYHVRWIEFRLLAEALRYAKYLTPLA